MRRRDFVLGAVLLAALPAAARRAESWQHGLLWRIEPAPRRGRPAPPPSWLFGTLHQRDPRLLPLPAPVEAAFRRCRSCLVEMFPDEAVAARFAEAARLDGDERLAHLLDPPVQAIVIERLARQGLTADEVDRLKPWAALLMLTSLPGNGANSLDNEIFVRARFANMRIEDLETVEEQIAVFDSIPLASQLALLTAAAELLGELPAVAEASVAAWLARDLAGLQSAGRRLLATRPGLAGHQRVLEKKIVHDRSVVMAYRMQGHLRRGAAFVAVGASHLLGREGIPSLLAGEYGCRVARVW